MSWCVECSIARNNQQEKWKIEKMKKKEANETKENKRENNKQKSDEEEAKEEEKEIKEAIYLGESRRGPGLRSSEHCHGLQRHIPCVQALAGVPCW